MSVDDIRRKHLELCKQEIAEYLMSKGIDLNKPVIRKSDGKKGMLALDFRAHLYFTPYTLQGSLSLNSCRFISEDDFEGCKDEHN